MPELPDVVVYIERLEAMFIGQSLDRIRLGGPFVLKSVDPPVDEIGGRTLESVERLGKRIVMGFGDDLFAVIHLMIAGRLRLRKIGTPMPKKRGLAAFDFSNGTILFTEEGTKRRASLHLVRGRDGLSAHDRGGVEPFEMDRDQFAAALGAERRTLKRTLTDPRLISGIGGAYADEIMHRAKVGPLTLTDRLSDDEVERLFQATRDVLTEWVDRLRDEVGDGFPEKVTAFHSQMAVHGRFGEPCPVCGSPVQRIRYASNETNYCARCQTGGRILADRALSRLLKDDFPRDLADLD